MENGIKYNIPGGRVTIRLHRQDDNAILTVEDTGVGIPEASISQIFERFYRVDKARSRQTGGSGLGLAIDDNAILTVEDTGVGIPEASISQIFERFYRVDKARSRQTGGSGLGLAIVRDMVQRNRGQIRVESAVGSRSGTTFTVEFPIFDVEEE